MTAGFSDATLLEFVEHIYAAGSDPSGWSRFVDRVNEEVPGVGFGCLLWLGGGSLATSRLAHAGYNPDSIKSLIEHYQHINPYEPIHKAMPVGKVVRATEVVTRDWLERQVFYHEWLKPAGNFTHSASLVLARDQRRYMRMNRRAKAILSPLSDRRFRDGVLAAPGLTFTLNSRSIDASGLGRVVS